MSCFVPERGADVTDPAPLLNCPPDPARLKCPVRHEFVLCDRWSSASPNDLAFFRLRLLPPAEGFRLGKKISPRGLPSNPRMLVEAYLGLV
jgi:hypothetical protein